SSSTAPRALHPFPTRRSSDLPRRHYWPCQVPFLGCGRRGRDRSLASNCCGVGSISVRQGTSARCAVATHIRPVHTIRCVAPHRRSEEHTSELQSRFDLVCRLL